MRIKVYFRCGRLRVIDTDSFSRSDLFGNNVIATSFTLNASDPEKSGVCLEIHPHIAEKAFKHGANEDEVPFARLYKGWKIVLVSTREVKDLMRLDLDGETIMLRIREELVCLVDLDAACVAFVDHYQSLSMMSKARDLDCAYEKVYPSQSGGIDSIASELNMSVEILDELLV